MHLLGGAAALAVLSFTSIVAAQDAPDLAQACQHKALWQTCNGEPANSRFQCATIKVRRDWDTKNANNDEIYLRLVRYTANTNPDQAESIIMNPGGPGVSGINYVYPNGGPALSRQSGGIYNIIGFDPRGVGQNMPYTCDNPTGVSYPGNEPDSLDVNIRATYFEARANYANAEAKQCASQRADFGKIISTVQTARDVRAIAQAVGVKDKYIRYWGFSYGTLLGNTIARLYATEVERMVLDGNADPNDWYFRGTLNEATNTDESIARFFSFCGDAGSNKCAWKAPAGQTHTYENLFQKYARWVGLQPDQPNRGRNDPDKSKKLTAQESYDVRTLVFQGMYRPKVFPKVAQILQYWYEDKSKIESPIDIDNYVVPTGTNKRQTDTTTNGASPNFNPRPVIQVKKATEGIRCLDFESHQTATGPLYSQLFDSYASKSKYGGDISILNTYACVPWVQRPTEIFGGVQWATGGIETRTSILFVQTNYDPVTPAIWGRGSRSYYSNARIVFTDGSGHCSNTHVSTELQIAIRNYWLSKTLPADETNYQVDNINPFTDNPTPSVVFPVLPPADEGSDRGGQAVDAKRDLSYLFETYKITKRETIIGDEKSPLYEVCNEEDDNTSSTTATQSSTSTGSTYTTTGTGATTTGTGYYGSTWATISVKKTTTWISWDPTPAPWNTWTPKQSDSWDTWSSQEDCIPVTKTVCAANACQTKVIAIPTKTIYIDYVQSICETGVTTVPITITATCTQGCTVKPTGIPQGYTEKAVYCSACATPATITITVKATGTSSWSDLAPASSTIWSVLATSTASVAVSANTNTWVPVAPITKSATMTSGWTGATGTASAWVSKYTGGASSNGVKSSGLLAAMLAGLWIL